MTGFCFGIAVGAVLLAVLIGSRALIESADRGLLEGF